LKTLFTNISLLIPRVKIIERTHPWEKGEKIFALDD
jgi:hypothetical protein